MKQKIITFIDGLGCMTTKEWVQMIVLALVVVNAALTMFGVNPIRVSEDFIYIAISGALVIVVPFYNKWKNWNHYARGGYGAGYYGFNENGFSNKGTDRSIYKGFESAGSQG